MATIFADPSREEERNEQNTPQSYWSWPSVYSTVAFTQEDVHDQQSLADPWPNTPWHSLHPDDVEDDLRTSRPPSPDPAELQNFGNLLPDGVSWQCKYPGCSSKARFRRGCDLRKHYRRHTKDRTDRLKHKRKNASELSEDKIVSNDASANQNPPCNTLYVKNLPIDTSEDELKAIFSKQRGYKRLCFRIKQNGPMCFVEFENTTFATKALNDLYGYPLHNSTQRGGLRLSFSKYPLGVRNGQPGEMGIEETDNHVPRAFLPADEMSLERSGEVQLEDREPSVEANTELVPPDKPTEGFLQQDVAGPTEPLSIADRELSVGLEERPISLEDRPSTSNSKKLSTEIPSYQERPTEASDSRSNTTKYKSEGIIYDYSIYVLLIAYVTLLALPFATRVRESIVRTAKLLFWDVYTAYCIIITFSVFAIYLNIRLLCLTQRYRNQSNSMRSRIHGFVERVPEQTKSSQTTTPEGDHIISTDLLSEGEHPKASLQGPNQTSDMEAENRGEDQGPPRQTSSEQQNPSTQNQKDLEPSYQNQGYLQRIKTLTRSGYIHCDVSWIRSLIPRDLVSLSIILMLYSSVS